METPAKKRFHTKHFIKNPNSMCDLEEEANFEAEDKLLGKGAFGKVYLVNHLKTKQKYF